MDFQLWKADASADLLPGFNRNRPSRGPDAWRTTTRDAEGTEYDLLFAEFDDQGQPFFPSAVADIVGHIEAVDAKFDPLIILFVHGWKHSARDDDGNVESFSRLLHASAHTEKLRPTRTGKPRRVVGVYVGWRGLTFHWLNLVQNVTFWGRKEAALRVALGSVRELFARLRAFRHGRTAGDGSGPRLVLIGHSFGGLIVYSAIAEYLIESAASATGTDPIVPFGDLTILVNPAFEAARYYPLHAIVSRRPFAAGQPPVFIAVTAANDYATGFVFPLGRFLSRILGVSTGPSRGRRERSVVYNTMGHVLWMKTHELGLAAGTPDSAKQTMKHVPRLSDSERETQLKAEDKSYQDFVEARTDEDGHLRRGWSRLYSSGVMLQQEQPVPEPGEAGIAPDNPFWIVEATAEVVDGHNGIFRAVFLDFLRQVFDDTIRAGSGAMKR